MKIVFVAALIMLLSSCSPRIPEISGTAYFVDCVAGDDSRPGTSPTKAWGSIDQVNQMTFQPGDGIFFKRGTICQGSLAPQGSGGEGHPIKMGAYGNGEFPIIDGGENREVIKLIGQEYWEIQDIETTGGTRFGVLISGQEGVEELNHMRLTNLIVHDVWGDPFTDKSPGLVVVLANGSIFKDVIIDGVTAFDTNQWAGIEVSGSVRWPIDWENPAYAEDVIVRNSTVYNVYGDGIVLWGVKNGLIEHSVAYDTGQQPSPQTIGTPSAIWTWSCYDCVVQYNEAYRSASPEVDAGCFDIDWGTRDNIYQYNYGHDCDGYCISVFGAGGTTTQNAVVRYNVCANNGRSSSLASRQGDIYLSTWGGGDLDGVLIHNNTSYWTPQGNYPALVNKADFTGDRPNIFANNIIVSTVPWMVDGNKSLKVDHNLFWIDGEGDPFFSFVDEFYKGFSDYQNLSGFGAHSIYADPLLNGQTYHEIGFPEEAFTLQIDSPAIDAGVNLENMGARDFFGNPIPISAAYDIGAHEWSPKKNGDVPVNELAASLGVLGPFVAESDYLLVGLINLLDEPSHSQVVFLQSMAHQFAESGLRVLLIDVSGMSSDQVINLAASWHMINIPILRSPTDIDTPTTMLFKHGRLEFYWDGLALPHDLAVELQLVLP